MATPRARTARPAPKRGRAPAKAAPGPPVRLGRGRRRRPPAGTPTPEVAPPVEGALTVEGAARLRAELETLTKVKRPEVIARIRAAKELGDLKENADYSSAREEQSFLEGRIQAIEARLRTAVIVDAPAAGARIGLGSAVSVRIDGEDVVLTIVGSSESDPATGRISSASPVGRALLGREAGDDVVVSTPAGDPGLHGRLGRPERRPRRPRSACARPRRGRPASVRRGRACRGCSTRRSGRCAP